MAPIPSVGRIVLIKLTSAQALNCSEHLRAGEVLPMIISCVYDVPAYPDTPVNGHAFLPHMCGTLFIRCAVHGDQPGQFTWPGDSALKVEAGAMAREAIATYTDNMKTVAGFENPQWTKEQIDHIKSLPLIGKPDPLAKTLDRGPGHDFKPEDEDPESCQLCCYARERHPDQKPKVATADETVKYNDETVRLRQGIG